MMLAMIAGPLVGGYITQHWSWRWIFYINMPIGGAALVYLWATLHLPRRRVEHKIDYLGATGFTVVHDVALALKALEFATVTPQEWAELARKHDRAEADGIFLSCTNTTQIEAIADIEQALGKPVVNSNQAVLWGCVKRLKSALAPLPAMPSLGRLMRQMDA